VPRIDAMLLTSHDAGQEIGDHAAINRLINGMKPGLMREQLSDGDLVLALL